MIFSRNTMAEPSSFYQGARTGFQESCGIDRESATGLIGTLLNHSSRTEYPSNILISPGTGFARQMLAFDLFENDMLYRQISSPGQLLKQGNNLGHLGSR